jgi:hypothetical protein
MENYEIKPIEEQINVIARIFHLNPASAICNAQRLPELPKGADGWFAVPNWKKVFSSHRKALEIAFHAIGETREFGNSLRSELSMLNESETERDFNDQEGDILIIAAQFGNRHRDVRIYEIGSSLNAREFEIGAFELACMLLTHPDRLSTQDPNKSLVCTGSRFTRESDYYCATLFGFGSRGDSKCSRRYLIFSQTHVSEKSTIPTGFIFNLNPINTSGMDFWFD